MDYQKLFDLTGKVCIVTGGMGYLGSGNVKALKDFGATVVVAGRSRYKNGKDRMPEGGDYFVQCDVSDAESVKAAFKEVYEKFGSIDVLVNCANGNVSDKGKMGFGANTDMEFMSDEYYANGVMACAGAMFRGMREVIPYMKEKGGSIINYSSMYGLVSPDLGVYFDRPDQKQPASYGAGKAAVVQVTRYAAGALAKYGIRVNCVTPGPFPNMSENEVFAQRLAAKTMLGRVGKNHEMAGAVVLLASDASTFMTGTNIVVDGGWTAW